MAENCANCSAQTRVGEDMSASPDDGGSERAVGDVWAIEQESAWLSSMFEKSAAE